MARFVTNQPDVIAQLELMIGASASDDNVVAFAGGGQTNATLLSDTVLRHRVTSVPSLNDSVKLPPANAAAVGQAHSVMNSAPVNAMQVFGSGTDTIDDIATATGVSHPALKGIIYQCFAVGKWYRMSS